MERIGDGAEAVIYKDINVIKERVKKSYRHKDIDDKLRKFRTRRESKVLEKLKALDFPAPRLIKSDDKEMKIEMDFIGGPKLRDKLDNIHLPTLKTFLAGRNQRDNLLLHIINLIFI